MIGQQYIQITNASLGYHNSGGELRVIEKLSLGFNSGELVGIVGKNGIGKSTLIKTISGLLPLLSGEILLCGKQLHKLSPSELAHMVSVVLTEKISGFNLTVFDVVAAGQIPYTDSFHRLAEKNISVIENSIKRCGIESYKTKLLSELSDGMFQKTIIAKSLAQQTPVMLLDEPSAFLDYSSKHNLFILLRDLAQSDAKCILVSSHDLDILIKYCTRLLIISNNSVELVPVNEAKNNKAFQEIAGGFL